MSLRDPSRFASWLYRIATNRAYNHQQHAKLVHMIPWEEYAIKEEKVSIAGPEEQVEEAELLKLALARVSPTYRPCLILYVVEEYSQRQIAELLQMKESNIGRYVSRGKEELRQIYRRLANESELSIRGGKQG
jgi:RNA polymerase sigma-70 factor (ECF subfamily)